MTTVQRMAETKRYVVLDRQLLTAYITEGAGETRVRSPKIAPCSSSDVIDQVWLCLVLWLFVSSGLSKSSTGNGSDIGQIPWLGLEH